jgi:hypothetical protein
VKRKVLPEYNRAKKIGRESHLARIRDGFRLRASTIPSGKAYRRKRKYPTAEQ